MKSKKESLKSHDELISDIKSKVIDCKKGEAYLFIGKAYDEVYEETVSSAIGTFVETYCVSDDDFNFDSLVNYCTDTSKSFPSGYLIVLRLKDKVADYQTRLLVPLERLTVPFMLFADSDCFTREFLSRFSEANIFKVPSEVPKVKTFIRIDRALSSDYVRSPYDCPTLIKLGDYNNLSTADKRMDMLISVLSGNGSVYSEVLAEQTPPIMGFDDDIKLEALSLLRNRLELV